MKKEKLIRRKWWEREEFGGGKKGENCKIPSFLLPFTPSISHSKPILSVLKGLLSQKTICHSSLPKKFNVAKYSTPVKELSKNFQNPPKNFQIQKSFAKYPKICRKTFTHNRGQQKTFTTKKLSHEKTFTLKKLSQKVCYNRGNGSRPFPFVD